MRKAIIAANWKMNKGPQETEEFFNGFFKQLGNERVNCEIVVAPPFVSLAKAADCTNGKGGKEGVQLAAQNVSDQDSGAFTGEVNVKMLKELFLSYVIIGHSERRSLYGETDALINAKFKKLREGNLRPIFCIGETLEEREAGKLEEVIRGQITNGLKDIAEADVLESVVAYEPVWAIGTGVTASPQQAQDAHAFVRSVLADLYGKDVAEKVRIQYGGSMKPENAAELMGQPDIDGGLVGGAALDPTSFAELVRQGAGAMSE